MKKHHHTPERQDLLFGLLTMWVANQWGKNVRLWDVMPYYDYSHLDEDITVEELLNRIGWDRL